MAGSQRVLAFAAGSGRIAHIVFERDDVCDWAISRKASTNETEAASFAAQWIERLRPEIVVLERPMPGSRKGPKTLSLITAMHGVAETAAVMNVAVVREQRFPNKFAEANALAKQYPVLAHLAPKPRKAWDSEPKNTVYFEALSLALTALGRPVLPEPAS